MSEQERQQHQQADLDPGERRYPPPSDFAQNANIQDPQIWQKAADDPEGFWESWAEQLHWFQKWDQVMDWDPPHVKWFTNGKINAAYNCLDYHIEQGRGDKTALIWEADEPGQGTSYTYNELLAEVNKCANALKELGVEPDDAVGIYLPMIPELPIAMLACARIGALHSVVFSAFAPPQLQERMEDAQAKVLFTADTAPRGGQKTPLKENADEGLQENESVQTVVVVRRTGDDVPMTEGRDQYWDELVDNQSDECEPEQRDSEDKLFVLYSSGSTGKPKGIIHTHGGYLTQLKATQMWVMDHKEDDVFWCTADIGWITGHSYLVYAPLLVGGTTVQFEGTPTYPESNRWFQVVEQHGVTQFYSAPTAIRSFMQVGVEQAIGDADISSIRWIGSVGEPINPAAWAWYHEVIGRNECPLVDTWWQTETGAVMIAPLPGISTLVPGSACEAFPGIFLDLWDEEEEQMVGCPGSGALVITRPWPSQLRTLFESDERYVEEYFSDVDEQTYFVEDGAKCDDSDPPCYTITGRIDDVINVSGHRLSTVEVENALVGHEAVAEAAVISRGHEEKGEVPVGFVILEAGHEYSDELRSELRDTVADEAGPVAKPDDVLIVDELPKTNSGKIMRRILENIAEGEELGDTSTLADPSSAERIQEQTTEQMQ